MLKTKSIFEIKFRFGHHFDFTKAIYVVLGKTIEKNLEVDEYFSNNAH